MISYVSRKGAASIFIGVLSLCLITSIAFFSVRTNAQEATATGTTADQTTAITDNGASASTDASTTNVDPVTAPNDGIVTTTAPDASSTDPIIAPDATSTPGDAPADSSTTTPADVSSPHSPDSKTTDQAAAAVLSLPVQSTTPALSTDKADYEPGENVSIFGKYFQGFSDFVLRIFGNSQVGNHISDVSVNVHTDADGSFSTNQLLDNFYRPVYTVTASTLTGTEIASMTFTDAAGASVDEFSQCANGNGNGPTCNWTNGNLNASNSTYHEDDATVQRLALSGLANGSHVVVIEYQTTKGGKHAYDFLTDDSYSENWVTASDICSSPVLNTLPSCVSLTPNASALIPADPNAAGHDTARSARHLKIRNGTITAIGTPTIVNGTYAGDSLTDIPVTFTVNTATCADKSSGGTATCPVLITWGAHVSTQIDWGNGNSAVNISGSPYHVKVVELDGASTGNRDNQMQAGAIIIPNSITIHKVTSPAGSQVSFPFTTTGTGFSNFSLTDGASSTQSVVPGSYSVTESTVAGWGLTGLTCTAAGTGSSATPNVGTRSVAITIGSAGGGIIDCTYTNTLQLGHLVVQKTTNPAADPTVFSITASGTGTITGGGAGTITDALDKIYEVTAGTYSVSEASTTGWSQTGNTCSGVSVAAGATSTCLITNTKNGTLKLVKTVINDNGGTATTTDFQGKIDGNNVAWNNVQTVSSGSHSASETNLPGYAAGNWGGDCATNGSVTVNPGDAKVCTITNNDIAPQLTVIKHVINDNGGTKVASNFTMNVTGTNVSSPSFAGAETPGTTVTLNAGSYSVDEASTTGYTKSIGANCSGTIAVGETKTCTITNDDQAAHIIVIKHVVNDNGGTKVASNFTMHIAGTAGAASFAGSEAGVDTVVNAGTYAVTEDAITGYAGSSSVDCSGSIALGQTKTCTITNNDIAPQLKLIKIVSNTHGGTATTTDWTLTATGPTTISGAGSASSTASFKAGDYALTESTGPSGYAASLWNCNVEQYNSSITLGLGDSAICTITNSDIAPQLTVIKHVINDNGGTKTASDFTMNVTGSNVSTPSFAGAENPGTTVTLNAGSYSADEASTTGYTKSIGANCSGTIAVGESKTCTITNDDQVAHLIVIKHVNNIHGGNNVAADFTMSFTGTAGSASFAGSEAGVNTVVNAGTYSVTEGAVTGYTGTSSADCAGSIANGETKTCTITNTDVAPTIKLLKVVNNNHGGTLGENDFGLTIGGATTNSGDVKTVDSNTPIALNEASTTGYTFVSLTGDAACPAVLNGTVTLNEGQNVTCTITNQDVAPKLIVIKHVINNNGGSKTASDFTMNVTGTNVSSPTFAGAETPGTTVTLNAGSYSADEASTTGYTKSLSTDCSGTISVGETKTCTITNDDQPAHLNVIKHVINDNGGTKNAPDFAMNVTATNASPASFAGNEAGTSVTLDAGSYSADETSLAGYAKTLGADCSGTIANGETKTCTITNNDIAPQLKLIKIVSNTHGGTATSTDWTLSATGPTTISGAGGASSTASFTAGDYALSESTGPSGYAASLWDCNVQQYNSSITLGLGDSAICTITNSDIAPKLTVIKHVINDNGGTLNAPDFTMNVAGTNVSTPSFAGAENPGTTVTLNQGSYNVTEGNVSGYASSTSADCSGTIAVGESKTCTITNNDIPAHLIVIKHVNNIHGGNNVAADFTMSFTGTAGSASFAGSEAGVNTQVNAGTYNVTEGAVTGYTGTSSADCAGSIANGETKTCTFTNTDIAPTITLTKVVQNTHGGTAGVNDFGLTIGGTATNSGDTKTVNSNTPIALNEASTTGYEFVSLTGDALCPAVLNGTVTLNEGQNVSCTITNRDISPKLIVIKHVINDNGGTKTASNFTMNVTGTNVSSPSFAGAETPGTTVTLNAGSYSADETALAGYTKTLGANCSGTIAVGETKTCTITNDDQPGHLIVNKITNPSSDTTTQFSITANGTSAVANATQSIVGGGTVNYTVNAGTYGVTEASTTGWSMTGNTCSGVQVANGATSTCSITNVKQAKLTIIKDAQPNDLQSFAFTANNGLSPSSFSLVDDGTNAANTKVFSNVTPGSFTIGETEPNSFWTFGGATCVNNATQASYPDTVSGTSATITLAPGADVTCTFINNKQSPTRTIGFWQTHTQYTSSVFNSAPISGNMPIGVAPHKGAITTVAQLFGGFYAPIPKTTTGAKRSAVDQARVQLLQQLIGAKLNCAAFTCAASVQSMIAAADAAYANGTAAQILAAASQMDAFNNSGDTLAGPNAGSASPQTSKSIADLAFWDLP